jgi:Arc/MetJ-type ribon-helix-helix transcriptional regulator
MTIHLPKEVENSINQAVLSGRFASMDDAMTKAAYLLLEQLNREPKPAITAPNASLGSIGAMRDAADELDQAVEHAMNLRQRPWRLPPGE